MRRCLIALATAASLLVLPSLAAAGGIAGAIVIVLNPADGTQYGSTQTDAGGAFAFEGLPEGSWLLGLATSDGAGQAWLFFSVPAEKAPARLAGSVTNRDGADLSLEVSATVGGVDQPRLPAGIILDPGYPKIQPAWNANWVRANGWLHVRLAGTGLEGLEKVVLTSAAGSIESTAIVQDPLDGDYHAIFAKKTAFEALVPADAVRGDVVAVTVDLTTAAGTETFDARFRIVGPRKPRRH